MYPVPSTYFYTIAGAAITVKLTKFVFITVTYKKFHSETVWIIIVIHAEHVVHRRGYCFHFGCMYVCMYVSALERKRLIGMT